MHSSCMATMPTTTITLNAKAYKLLKDLKQPGNTFSDVVIEYVRPPARTAGELLKDLEEIEGQPIIDDDLMREVRAGRSQKRSRRHVA